MLGKFFISLRTENLLHPHRFRPKFLPLELRIFKSKKQLYEVKFYDAMWCSLWCL